MRKLAKLLVGEAIIVRDVMWAVINLWVWPN